MLGSKFESQFNSIFGVPSHRNTPNIGACSGVDWESEDFVTDDELVETGYDYDNEDDDFDYGEDDLDFTDEDYADDYD